MNTDLADVDYCFWCPECEEPEGVCTCRRADDYSAALVELTLALTEWKEAGADVLTVTGAIQRFISAINAKERLALEGLLPTEGK